MIRIDGRDANEMRKVRVTKDFMKHAEGSVLIEIGDTKVICTATVEENVPRYVKGTGKGWISSEYDMLPRSTHQRKQRAASKGKVDGRAQEIQRLIGRTMRSIVDLEAMGEIMIWIDCDVMQADGGTRTASITGAFMALYMALEKLVIAGKIKEMPIKYATAAVSVGILDGHGLLDLKYEEDSSCQVDMNIIMNEIGEIVELQGTGEEKPFTRAQLDELLALGEKGIRELIDIQKQILGK